MRNSDRKDEPDALERCVGMLMILIFAVGSLAFLVAIDRPHWFQLRPASGVAASMAYAADRPLAPSTAD